MPLQSPSPGTRRLAATFECEAQGELAPNNPDGHVLRAEWVAPDEALRRLARTAWYECRPLARELEDRRQRLADAESVGLRRGRVVLRDYDRRWRGVYGRERALLFELLDGLITAIEHVGSTAVNGLAAKPIIDMALGFRKRDDLEAARQLLQEVGYDDRGDFGEAGGVAVGVAAADVDPGEGPIGQAISGTSGQVGGVPRLDVVDPEGREHTTNPLLAARQERMAFGKGDRQVQEAARARSTLRIARRAAASPPHFPRLPG